MVVGDVERVVLLVLNGSGNSGVGDGTGADVVGVMGVLVVVIVVLVIFSSTSGGGGE